MHANSQPQLPGLEFGRVADWLASTVPGLRPPLDAWPVGEGRSNLTYLVTDAGGRRLVLRRPPLGPLLAGAHDMRREYRVLEGLSGSAVPAPRPLGFSADLTDDGNPLYAMEHVDGIVVRGAAVAERLEPAARMRSGISMAETLAAVHAVDVDRRGLGDLGRREGYAARQLRRWSKQWEASHSREIPAIERVGAALRAAEPASRETTLVHGDYNLANVILDDDGAVVAVLDWELCTLGDPVADLGTLVAYWPDDLESALPERDPVTLLPGFASSAQVIEAYAAAAPDRDLSTLPFWHALAAWKLAIILQGVHVRQLGNPSNAKRGSEHVESAVGTMAGIAERIVESWSR